MNMFCQIFTRKIFRFVGKSKTGQKMMKFTKLIHEYIFVVWGHVHYRYFNLEKK